MNNFKSKIPRREYVSNEPGQRDQLVTDPQILGFEQSRRILSLDMYRPLYHFVNPEGNLNDPNGLCYWNDRYHLFYQAYPPDDPRQHWGHAVSEDLVYWEDLPIAIYPDPEKECFSGSTFVEKDRVIAIYHGTQVGNMIAISKDPLLLNWEKMTNNPVIPINEPDVEGKPYRIYDPCIWRENDGYYSLSGTYWKGDIFDDCEMVQHLFFSKDLSQWTYIGPFVEGGKFTNPGEDGAVPYFWPIGDRHILVFASHMHGSQYLLGDYNSQDNIFHPSSHGRFNFGPSRGGGVHAPSATPDGEGGLYVINNINDGKPTEGWNHIMSLVRRLQLKSDGALGIEVGAQYEKLRKSHVSVDSITLPANEDIHISKARGNAIELLVSIDTCQSREVSIDVLRSRNGEERTTIRFLKQGHVYRPYDKRSTRTSKPLPGDALVIDTGRSSLHKDVVPRPPEIAPFDLPQGELLQLRIFVDKSVVEVFANGTQCAAVRVYPSLPDSQGISLCSYGDKSYLKNMDVWDMADIWRSQ